MELGGRSRSARRCRRPRGSRSPRRILCSRAVPNPFSTALVAEHSAANFELSRVPTETFSPQMHYRDNRDTQVLVLTRAPRLRELERLPKPRRGRLRRGGSSRVARGQLREEAQARLLGAPVDHVARAPCESSPWCQRWGRSRNARFGERPGTRSPSAVPRRLVHVDPRPNGRAPPSAG